MEIEVRNGSGFVHNGSQRPVIRLHLRDADYDGHLC